MIRKEELLKMKERLNLLISKYTTLCIAVKPKKHFLGLLSSGNLYVASQMSKTISSLRTQVRMIDWMLQKEASIGYEEYDVEVMEECVEEWLNEVRKRDK